MNARTDKIEAQELSPNLQRFAKFQIAVAVIAVVITLATTITIYPLIQKRAQLKTEISQLQSQRAQEIQQKNEEIEQLQKRIKELQFKGKFGILLETDGEKDGGLESAKINVYEKGKDHGFDPVYIFKDADGYKTVAVFDDREKAKEKLPLAQQINRTAALKDFSVFCPNPKWADDGEYFDCLKE